MSTKFRTFVLAALVALTGLGAVSTAASMPVAARSVSTDSRDHGRHHDRHHRHDHHGNDHSHRNDRSRS